MDQQPAFSFRDLFRFVISDMVKAIAERDGEAQEQRFARSQAAAHMILGFSPRDVAEAMLAGHCVMLHEVMTANARTTLRGGDDAKQRGPRSNVIGLNKAFNDNLDRLERHQQRPAEGCRDAAKEQIPVTPDSASAPPTATTEPQPQPRPAAQGPNRALRRQAARAEMRAAAAESRAASRRPPATSSQTMPDRVAMPDQLPPDIAEIAARHSSSPEAMAACKANPEAIAALQSGDPVGFARAMDIEHPCEAFLSAAHTKGSPFDPHSSGSWATSTIAPAPRA
jgi:hypothetical protein